MIAIDTGGTFTDVVFLRDGALHLLKLPSTPDDPARAVIEGIRQALPRLAESASLDVSLIHGSTVATNALLERRGARVALVTNRGLEDVIEIGRQNRPRLYALSDVRPAPLVERELRFGVAGRLDHTGAEIEALGEADVVALKPLLAAVDAIAICLLHSYANDAHERRVAALLRDLDRPVSVSSEILPEYREYERTTTTVVNAYVARVMGEYLARLDQEAAGARVRIMGSAGGTVALARACREPVHTVLSGPAGGVAGALSAAQAAGCDRIISFDMGGTSTDVSLCPGEPLFTREFSITGVPVAVPVLDIHTVGAGGGSVAWMDAGGALRVGPRSAGAVPGPICYGQGGAEVTVTDANVWLGRLPAASFLGGARPLDRGAIAAKLGALAGRLGLTPEATAAGVLEIVNSTMEGALRVISVERGYDPLDFTLVAFGGAGGLHAAELADRLGIPRVLVPPHPGVLSAFGMLASPVRKDAARTVLLRSDAEPAARLRAVFDELAERARAAMAEEGVGAERITLRRMIDARYHGQSHELRVPAEEWMAAFHAAHAQRYGYEDRGAVVEAVTLRVEATGPLPRLPAYDPAAVPARGSAAGPQPVFYAGEWHDARQQPRASLEPAHAGPLVITDYSGTIWVPPGWHVERQESGALLLRRG